MMPSSVREGGGEEGRRGAQLRCWWRRSGQFAVPLALRFAPLPCESERRDPPFVSKLYLWWRVSLVTCFLA